MMSCQTAFGILLLSFSLAIYKNYGIAEADPVVTIKNGTLKGTLQTSTHGKPYNAFMGIPYAKPPVRELRFKPPQPPEAWTGTKDARKDGSICLQAKMMTNELTGDENCLFLNVYVPQTNPGNLPVLVFIHGGGYSIGSGTNSYLGPQKFMDLDLVLVTINYRLGVFGFLSTGDAASHGNYGMLDQVQALRWIQENIKAFGGDPEKVAIFGESAGGSSVVLLILSPLSKGLFQAAIAQSGSLLNGWAIQRDPLFWAKKIAKEVYCPIERNKEMITCVKELPQMDVAKAALKFYEYGELFPIYLAPVVEGPGGAGFLTEDPLIMLEKGHIENRVPFIAGITRDEGATETHSNCKQTGVKILNTKHSHNVIRKDFKTTGKEYFLEEFPSTVLHYTLSAKIGNDEERKRLAKLIQKEYFPNDEVIDQHLFYEGLSKILSDVLVNAGADNILQQMANAGIPTYAYHFTHLGQRTIDSLLGLPISNHVTHLDDVAIQFNTYFIPPPREIPESEDDLKMANLMNTIWKNIAASGIPSFEGTSLEDKEVKWLPYNTEKPNYLELNLNPVMKEGFLSDKSQFWTNILGKYVHPKRTKDEL